MNKKIFLLMLVGIFSILFFSNFINSATKEVKIDWLGFPFEWCSDEDDHNVEFCGYDYDKFQHSCNENSDCSNGICSGVYKATNGDIYRVVYLNYWYNAKCKSSGHGVDNHFANSIGEYNDGSEFSQMYTPSHEALANCYDLDGDGYYSAVYSSGINQGVNTVCGNSETNMCDNNPSVHVATTEIPDLMDNNCDGQTDEGFVCMPGQTQPCGTTHIGECQIGIETCINGQWDSCTGAVEPIAETADGYDNDCDGQTDEGFECIHGQAQQCGTTDIGECQFGTKTCASGQWGSCIGYVGPTTEICNDNIDNNCDGQIDSADSFCQKAYWTSDSQGQNKITSLAALPFQKVYLVLDDPYGTSSNWKFNIVENDIGFCFWGMGAGCYDEIRTNNLGNALTGNVLGNKIIAEWTITPTDINKAITEDSYNIYEFYFIVMGDSYFYPSPILQLEWAAASCTSGGTQSCYTGTTGTANVGECKPGTKNCINNVWGPCQNEIIPTAEICDDEKDNNCDGAVDESSCQEIPIDCPQTLCSDYLTESPCASNSCQLNSQTPTLTCPSDATSCSCSWNAGSCDPSFDVIDPIGNSGTCSFKEGTPVKTCENDGELEYDITATWSITGESGPSSCKNGKVGPIFCSSKTKLPLENKFGILLTIISIIGIYFLFFRRNKILKIKDDK
ncbi:MAG: putative metal-binding motif-containing protein [Nanoarchaeota archaeon]